MHRLLVFICALCLFASYSYAQVINIEDLRRSYSDKGLHGNLNLSLARIHNTLGNMILVNNKINAVYISGKHAFLFFNHVELMRVDGINFENNAYQNLRYNYDISRKLVFETFAQYQYNEILMLKQKVLYGLGPRFRIVSNDSANVIIGLLGMYNYELLTDKTVSQTMRLDVYLALSRNFGGKVNFSSSAYYLPAIADFSDYRIAGSASVSFKFAKSFAFGIGYSGNFDSQPPAGIEKYYDSIQNTLSFSF